MTKKESSVGNGKPSCAHVNLCCSANFRKQAIVLRGITSAARPIRGCARLDGCLRLCQVALPRRKAIESIQFPTFSIRPRFGPEVVFEILPVIPALVVGPQGPAGII